GVPVQFDVFQHALNNRGESVKEAFAACSRTWDKEDGLPMVDFSLQKEGARPGTHAETIIPSAFRGFAEEIAPLDCDIMLEIKDKEKSAQIALRVLAGDPRLVT
ncbi:MAG: UV DNA damage repair endonuclease UvsE, partial [Endomicrobiales bacterium]